MGWEGVGVRGQGARRVRQAEGVVGTPRQRTSLMYFTTFSLCLSVSSGVMGVDEAEAGRGLLRYPGSKAVRPAAMDSSCTRSSANAVSDARRFREEGDAMCAAPEAKREGGKKTF